MKTTIDCGDCPATPSSSAIKFVILYEDRTTGMHAKAFADLLAAADSRSSCVASLWRSEMLVFPTLASRAAEDAADCDFIVVSLRGSGVVPFAIRDWLEARLRGAGARDTALIALFEPIWSGQRAAEGARHYFRSLCAERGVAFFSHIATPPEDQADECHPRIDARSEPPETSPEGRSRQTAELLDA